MRRPLTYGVSAALGIVLGLAITGYLGAGEAAKAPAGKRPYNLIFIICDQESYHVRAGQDFVLPARQALQRRGVTLRNHYIGSAVCTPSRALIFTGQAPQVNGVYDHLAFGFVPSLSTERPSMGTLMKGLGYRTAYFGKYELNTKVLAARRTDNTSTWLQPYGFDVYNADGDNHGRIYDGFAEDPYIAGAGIRWLRSNVPQFRKDGEPFFMVLSLVNPHDIMFADANVPGQPRAPLDREKHKGTIVRLNRLLNELMAREVGVNDGRLLPRSVRPRKGPPE